MGTIIQKAYAASNYKFNIFSIKTSGNISISDLVGNIASLITIIASVIAFFFFIYSGFLYLTANGNPDQAKKGQSGIINAIIGLIIIALAYVILRAVAGSLGGTNNNINSIGGGQIQ